jgi:capsular polysaccharide biosynthesis protein
LNRPNPYNNSENIISIEPKPESASFTRTPEKEHLFSLEAPLQTLRKRVWLVLLVPFVFMGAAMGFALLQTPLYESSIKILVGQERESGASANLGSDVQGLQQLTKTMAEGVNSDPIADDVIQRLDLEIDTEDFLERHLSVRQIPQTQFIEVSYRDSSPQRAQQVANTVGETFASRVAETSTSANAVTATVWQWAKVPDEPVSPNLVFSMGLGLLIGLGLGVGLAFLLESLDDSWSSSPEEVEAVGGVPTFAVIPEFNRKRARHAKSG